MTDWQDRKIIDVDLWPEPEGRLAAASPDVVEFYISGRPDEVVTDVRKILGFILQENYSVEIADIRINMRHCDEAPEYRRAHMRGWHTMANAPKDRSLLLYGTCAGPNLTDGHPKVPIRVVGYWDEIDQRWCISGSTWEGPFFEPQLWHKLPDLPETV